MISLGVDIGGTSVKMAAREDGKWLWTSQSPFYRRPSADQLRAAISAAAAGRLKRVDAAGMCVPGLLDKANRVITRAVNVPGLDYWPLDEIIPSSLGIPVAKPVEILNDGRSTAYDIYQSRRVQGRLLVLPIGTGVGACVLDDGKPLVVESEAPGHIGQLDVSIAGHDVIGPDGGAGGLEGYIGAGAIARRRGDDVSAALAKFTGDEVEILALVRCIRICHAIYRPHHICLCGGIGIRLKHLLPVIRKRVETHLSSVARPDWTLTTGDDDFHAARGAAQLASLER